MGWPWVRGNVSMVTTIVSDELWNDLRTLLPPPKPRRARYPGRKPLDERKVLAGILFVVTHNIAWGDLPPELGCGAGMTCWRRLREWKRRGVWTTMQRVLRERLEGADKIDWSRCD
jgi:transposase